MERKPRYDAQRKFSGEQKREMAERQEYTCPECGQSFWRKPLSQVQAHHIFTFAKHHGATEISNGVLLCPECHKKVDREAIIEGKIWPGNYSEKDADESQIRGFRRFF